MIGRYNPHMMVKVRSKKIMKSAKGKPCTLRIASFFPGYSCAPEDQTVLCHIDKAGGKGTSTKVSDMGGAYSCPHCDDIVTGLDMKRRQYIEEKYPMAFGQRIYSALVETHAMLIDDGIVVVIDGEIIR